MGIVLTGTSFGGVLVPIVARPLITSYGWRAAMLAVSAIVWVALLPAVLIFVRSRRVENADDPDEAGEVSGLTLFEALSTTRFWIFALCAAAIFYPIFATSQQFILHIQKSPSIAVDAATASVAQSFLFATSVGGKFIFGWLSDRLATTRVMLMCCGVMFLATLLLLGFMSAGTVFLFLVPFGLGYGGTFVILQLLAVEFFGLRDIGRIIGALTVVETLGAAIGGAITGRLASAYGGDYTVAFYGVTIAAGIALVSVLILNSIASRPQRD